MKSSSFSSILLLFVFSIVFTACGVSVKGSGKVITRDITIDSFSKIDINAPLDVLVEKGSSYSLSFVGDDNLVELLEVKQSNGTLLIKCTRRNCDFKDVKAHITLPSNVDEVRLSGVGQIELKAPINPSQFNASMSGIGKLHLVQVETEKMNASLSGMGKLQASGQVRDLDLNVSGMGAIDCNELKAANAVCRNSGMGSISVYATESLDARLSGMGSLTYSGNPAKIDKKVSGMGRISAK